MTRPGDLGDQKRPRLENGSLSDGVYRSPAHARSALIVNGHSFLIVTVELHIQLLGFTYHPVSGIPTADLSVLSCSCVSSTNGIPS
jgi:hypothetical protein